MNDSPVFIVDGDLEDKEFIEEAWRELNFENKLYFFNNADDVIKEMEIGTVVPFLIISEINLPKTSGLELKRFLMKHKYTHFKSIPFVFLTDSPSPAQIDEAYHLCTNGLFIKQTNINDLKQQLIDIVKYWRESIVPM